MRVIFFEVDPHFQEVAAHLQRDMGWEVVYLTGTRLPGPGVWSEFGDAVFHEDRFASRGLDADGRPPAGLPPPCPTLLERLSETESQAIQMMDRMDPDGRLFSYRERLYFYYALVAQWDRVITQYRPDLAVWPISPHMAYDFVAFSLCKERNVPTLMFERTALPARMLRLSDFRHGSEDVRRRLAQASGRPVSYEDLEPQTQVELTNLQSVGENATSARMRGNTRSKFARRGAGVYRRLFDSLCHDLRVFLKRRKAFGLGGAVPRNNLKAPGQSIQDSRMTYPVWWSWRIRGYMLKEALRREYGTIEKAPDFDRPFVFLGLHCQPERMTSPLGGRFTDQLLWVRTVADNLPEGWEVYVKEHPWQLEPRSRGHLGRWRGYYRQMASQSRVRVVPIGTPAPELIDRAQAVIALSGSVGFQAVVRGKPVVACGEAWYRDMPGVIHARSAAQIRGALDRVRQGFGVDMEAVLAYLKVVEEASVRMWLEPQNEPTGGIDSEACIANTAESIAGFAASIGRGEQRTAAQGL